MASITRARTGRLALGVSCVAIIAGMVAAPVAAQQAATAEPADAEIVVTAQKRAEALSTVPAAIQAFRGETLEQRGTNQLTQLVDFIPGASVVSASAPGFETIQIRGISSGTVGDATVGYYVDDVAFGVPNLQLTPPSRLFDLERTEVLRGPQGTLYGTGAMGGLIRLVTAAPDLKKIVVKGRGELSFTDGGGTNYNFDGVLSVPIVTDKVALRVTGGYEKLSGFARVADRPAAKNVNDTESYSIRAKLLVKPTDDLDITLSAWRISNHQNYGNNLLSVNPAVEPSSFGTNPFVRTVANIYSGLINYDLGPVSLQSATSYVDHELKLDITANTGGLGVRAVDDFKTHSFNEEVRLVSNGTGPLKYVVGAIYTDARILSNFDVTVVVPLAPPLILPFQSTRNAPLTTKSYAVYGEASYELFDGKLIPLVGLRYYNDKRGASGFTSIAGGAATFDKGSAKFDSVSPRFNLTFKPGDGALIYGNIAKGFRSGTIQTAGQGLSRRAAGRRHWPDHQGGRSLVVRARYQAQGRGNRVIDRRRGLLHRLEQHPDSVFDNLRPRRGSQWRQR